MRSAPIRLPHVGLWLFRYGGGVGLDMRFLRLADVRSRVGLSRSQIYRQISTGDFPKAYSLGARAVAWLESEIDSWIEARVEGQKAAGKATAAAGRQSK